VGVEIAMSTECSHPYIARPSETDESLQFTGLFLPSDKRDDAAARVMAEVTELGLERNAWELDSLGYTVVTPERVGAGHLPAQLRDILLDLAEMEIGFRPDLDAD
jgi:hypothetical protein